MGTAARVFYPANTAWDGTGGAVVKKLLDAGTNSQDTTTKVVFGTNTTLRTIIVQPYTSNSTSGTTGEQNFGWAVNVSSADGMQSTAPPVGHERVILAGSWSFAVPMYAALTQTGLSGDQTTLTAVIYRVSSSGTRTELGRGSSAATTVTGLTAGTPTNITWAVTLGQVTLAADETVQVSLEVQAKGNATGQTLTVVTQPSTNPCTVTLPAPGVVTAKYVSGTVYDTTGTPVVTATVKLLTSSGTWSEQASTASDASGFYIFQRAYNDTGQYVTVAYSASTVHGISDLGNVPA